MKIIVKHFGAGLLAAAVGAMLVFLLLRGIRDNEGNVGILNMVGARMDTAGIDYHAYHDFDGYKTEAEKTGPVINQAFPVFAVGSTVKVSDYVTAIDYAGNRLAVHITRITAPDGTAVTAGLPGDTDIILDQTGNYAVSLYAVDDGNRKTICSMQILVNR